MYSGTTLRNASGKIIGAHQKLDRVARRALEQAMPGSNFPSIREILHFEGKNGPDGIKSKSPAKDEPWHYYDPTDPKDVQLIGMIERHSKNLSAAIKTKHTEKAAFEAAWLAHALVDGLTPAHHFPLEAKLEELRGGAGIETRTSLKEKLVVGGEGDTRMEMLAKNWEMWGAKGVMTTHGTYEWGVATTIAPLRLRAGYPTAAECEQALKEGITPLFKRAALGIYEYRMYDRFSEKGWTRKLARETREFLGPLLVKVITLAWYEALVRAQQEK
jgi:hypothetical protein